MANYLNLVEEVEICQSYKSQIYWNTLQAKLKDGKKVYVQLKNVEAFLSSIESNHQSIQIKFTYEQSNDQTFENITTLIYLLGLGVFFRSAYKYARTDTKNVGAGFDIFNFSKVNAKVYTVDSHVKIRFQDVAGMEQAKQEVIEFVDFLKSPEKYKKVGARLPRGVLLSGPPGTGKTLLAKVSLISIQACAGEAGVPFFLVSGSDFVELFVGIGASRVRDLFKQAKERSPAIIFIDEIDAIGRKRDSKVFLLLGRMGNEERDNTLNQLLVEMDGFNSDNNVIVLAATNRKELLDASLVRPGRFDRTVDISLPDIEGRKQILMVHLKPLKLDTSKDIEFYARRLSCLTPKFSGADVANMCNEAALLAARKNKKLVQIDDLEQACEKVIAGLVSPKKSTQEELERVAYIQAGTAVASWFLKGGHPLLKISINKRVKQSIGFIQYLPNEAFLHEKDELIDQLCVLLSGRVTELHFLKSNSSAAAENLKKAYELTYQFVSKLGMSDSFKNICFQEDEFVKLQADETQFLIDKAVKGIIHEATDRTSKLIADKEELITKLKTELLAKQTLNFEEICAILGNRPFEPKSNFKFYLAEESSEELNSVEHKV